MVGRLRRLFEIDPRSLIAFRIAISVFGLFDLFIRLHSLTAHYTDNGVLPRKYLLDLFPNQWSFNFYMISGGEFFTAFLFAVHAFCFVALLMGYRTKLFSILCWAFTVSIQNRGFLMNQGGDAFYKMMLFWAMFVPLDPKEDKPVLSFGTAAILLQVSILYVFTGLLKNGDQWRNGTAVYFAMHIDQFARPLAHLLRDNISKEIYALLTYSVQYFEIYGSLLLYCPLFFVFFRTLGILGFITLQIGFSLFLVLGPFPYITILSMLLFVPKEIWDDFKIPELKFVSRLHAKRIG
jgi:hypothetical protein